MSMEQVKAFRDKIAADEALKEKIKAIRKKDHDIEVLLAEVTALATAEGFDVTVEDIVAARKASSELSEKELEQVAGGKGRVASGMCCQVSTQCNCEPYDCGV